MLLSRCLRSLFDSEKQVYFQQTSTNLLPVIETLQRTKVWEKVLKYELVESSQTHTHTHL